MDFINAMIYSLDVALDTERKRHILGGILLSAALLFGGLAATIFTIQNDSFDE